MAEPKKKKKRRIDRQTIPIYAVGVTWLLYGLRHGLHSPHDFIACGLLSALVFVLLYSAFREKKEEGETEKPREPSSGASRVRKTGRPGKATKTDEPVPPRDEPPREERPPEPEKPAEPAKPAGKYDAFVERLNEFDEQIPDPVVSAKLKQMRELAKLIFRAVEEQPEKEEKIRRLVDYYLPTTYRLLEHYVQMQDKQVGDGTVREGMEKISSLLDSMIVALKRQLDALYRADVVDITADIRVMEKKLAAEGLTDQEDF